MVDLTLFVEHENRNTKPDCINVYLCVRCWLAVRPLTAPRPAPTASVGRGLIINRCLRPGQDGAYRGKQSGGW